VELFLPCLASVGPERRIDNFEEGVVIHIKTGQGADPYFDIPMPNSKKGWRKLWIYLRNDADASLPTFTGKHPIPHSNLGYEVAKKDLGKLQPLLTIIQQLWQQGWPQDSDPPHDPRPCESG
jgi:hypothetical protein